MSRRKYPRIGESTKATKKMRIKCNAKTCINLAQIKICIQLSYMRGDDEIYPICNHHKRIAESEKWEEFYSEILPT